MVLIQYTPLLCLHLDFQEKFLAILPVLLMSIVVTTVTINDVPVVRVTAIQTVVGVRGGGWLKKIR